MRAVLSFFAILIATLVATAASGHESRPLYVEIVERAPESFAVTWKIPPTALAVTMPALVMPSNCTASAPTSGTQLVKRQLFRCADDLSGKEVQVVFPDFNPSISTLFRLQRLSGERHTALLGPEEPAWRVPAREETVSVAMQYMVLGIEHILVGYDHLLFVACLVLIAGTWRRILITVTGFTVAHSITLALSALDIFRVPIAPVEAVIALSIVFLACEIARERRDTLTWKYPIAVAVSFGLLHGFGFASVLGEIGLPQIEIPAALLFFNLGVEIGQILFVAILLGAAAIWAAAGAGRGSKGGAVVVAPPVARTMAYFVGGVAAFWMIERMAGFLV